MSEVLFGEKLGLKPRGSILGNPEKLLKEVRWEARVYEFLHKGKVVGTKGLQITRFTEKDLQKISFYGKI